MADTDRAAMSLALGLAISAMVLTTIGAVSDITAVLVIVLMIATMVWMVWAELRLELDQ